MFKLKKPVFKSSFIIELLSEKELLIRDEEMGLHLFQGEIYTLLARLLKEARSLSEIFLQAEEKYSAAEVYYGLIHLENGGYLREEDSCGFSPPLLAILDTLSILPADARKRLDTCPIGFTSLGGAPIETAFPFFDAYPFSRYSPPRLQIVFTDHYRRKELADWSRETTIPWVLVKGAGLTGWAGPIFIPGKSPSYECLLHALERNQFEEILAEKNPVGSPRRSELPIVPIQNALFSRLGLEIFKWIVTTDSPLVGQIGTVDLKGNFEMHRVIRLGTPSPDPTWELREAPILSRDGGFRSVDPESTWKTYCHLISPITGAVHSVKAKKETSGAPIYIAHHNPVPGSSAEIFIAGKYRNVSAGKGQSHIQAKTGALCESLERISGVFRGEYPRISSSWEEMVDDEIHPNEVMLFSEAQYAQREIWNQTSDPFNLITRPFDSKEKTDWTPLWSFNEKKKKWLPTAVCYFGYPQEGEKFSIGNSNGCAAGNTLEEAILQGFLELVERDGVALWWYPRLECPSVDLGSFHSPFFDRIVHQFESLGREVWVLDLMSDLPIPIMAALSRKKDPEDEKIFLGFGAHFDPEIAISRALTEMVQSYHPDVGDAEQNFMFHTTLKKEPHLAPGKTTKRPSDYPSYSIRNIKEAVSLGAEIVQKRGMELLLLDQTRPDIGLPVVRVVVPGLRHFWARFAPGRLYEVPYQLGRVTKRLREEELNPNRMLF